MLNSVLSAGVGTQNGGMDFIPILGGILSFLLICFAFGYAMQLYRYTRGGQSARAWVVIGWALLFWAGDLIIELGRQTEIFSLPRWIEVLVTFLGALLLAIGFAHQKKVLR